MKMDPETWVQIQDKAICIPHYVIVVKKDANPIILP